MTKFTEWCDEIETSVSSHRLHQLTAKPAKLAHATTVIAGTLPQYYAAPSRIADLLNKLGKPAAAKYVAEKLPTTKSIRSGDLAEILCNAYVLEATAFTQGIKRLRWKDHRNMSMRGEDVLAFSFDAKGKLYILKAEVKSRVPRLMARSSARTLLGSIGCRVMVARNMALPRSAAERGRQ